MRQKKISKEKYMELFCREKRIRERMVLYVSPPVHDKLRRVAGLFREQYVTTSSLVDAILTHHISIHRDLLREMEKEMLEGFTGRPRRDDDGEEYAGDEQQPDECP